MLCWLFLSTTCTFAILHCWSMFKKVCRSLSQYAEMSFSCKVFHPLSNPFKPSIITGLRSEVHVSFKIYAFYTGDCDCWRWPHCKGQVCLQKYWLGTAYLDSKYALSLMTTFQMAYKNLPEKSEAHQKVINKKPLLSYGHHFSEKHVFVFRPSRAAYNATFDICFGGGLKGWIV